MSNIHFWTPVYRVFQDQPLLDADLEAFYVRRDNSPVDTLAVLLAMEDEAAKFLLAGHRGSGKTTELKRLERRCAADYTVVWVDTDTALDKFNIGYAEVVVLIGMSIVKQLAQVGWQLPKKLEQALLDSLAKVTYQGKKEAGGTLQLPKVFQDLGMLLKVGFQRETIKTLEVRPALSEIIERVNAIIAEAERAKPKLLVIVDGLDRKDYGIALEMFSSSLMTALNCHIVYAVPIALRYAAAFKQPMESFEKCLDLANIPVFKCDEMARSTPEIDKVGRHILASVLDKRLATLGEAYKDLFAPDAVELLGEKSGGVMRDLVRLARTASEVALRNQVERVDLNTAEAAVHEERKTYTIADYHYPVMHDVHRKGQLTSNTFDSPQHGKIVICDELLQYKLILGYEDPKQGRWFDIHPILAEDLARWQAEQPTEG